MTALFIIIVTAVYAFYGSNGAKTPRELETSLFSNYSRKWRPALVKSQKTIVTVGLYLRDMNKVDEKQQIVTIHGGLHLLWNDYRVRWNAAEHQFWYLVVSPWRIWRPDWTVYNSFQPAGVRPDYGNAYDNQAWIYYDGSVSYYTIFTKPITCVFDYSNYPFDVQTCTMLIGSWMYDYSQMDFIWSKTRSLVINWEWMGSSTNRTGASGWTVERVSLSKQYLRDDNTLTDQLPPLGYDPTRLWPLLSARVILRRHRPCYGLLEFTPLLLTALLTLSCFSIRSESLAICVLSCALLVQGVCSWAIIGQIPSGGTGNRPKILKTYGACFGLTSTALLLHIFLQRARMISGESGIMTRILDVTSKPWFKSLRPVDAVRIASFSTDYQEIIQLTSEMRTIPTDHADRVDKAVRIAKAVLCPLFAMVYLVCISTTFW